MRMIFGIKERYMLLLMTLMVVIPLISLNEGFCLGKEKEPTAIVVDDETGEPIEGAVAIAIWRKHSNKDRWFEGGTEVVVRIEEAVSDKEGKMYIDGFFGLHLYSYAPRLTIYKFGYVCWDQKQIYMNGSHDEKRQDFDKKNKTAKLKKWPEGFSFNAHWSFMDSVTQGDIYESSEKLFKNAFDYEIQYRIQENNKKNKEKEEKKIKEMNK